MKNDGQKKIFAEENECKMSDKIHEMWIFMVRTRTCNFFFYSKEYVRVRECWMEKPKISNPPTSEYIHISASLCYSIMMSWFSVAHEVLLFPYLTYINLTSRPHVWCSDSNSGRFRGRFISFREFLAFIQATHLSPRLRSSRFSMRAWNNSHLECVIFCNFFFKRAAFFSAMRERQREI